MINRATNLRWFNTLFVLCIIMLCLTGIPAVLTDPVPHTLSSVIFYGLALISQSFLFSAFLAIVLLPVFLLARSPRSITILSTVFVALAFIICFINAKVFSFWRFYINNSMLHMLFIGRTEVLEVHDALYTWVAMAVCLLLVVSFVIVRLSRQWQSAFNWRRMAYGFLLIYIVVQTLFLVLCMQNNMRVLKYASKIPYFYSFSWVNGLQSLGVPVFPKTALATDLQSILTEGRALHYPLHPLQYHLPAHPLNVLFIVVDTLRYDMVNPVNMPHLWQFSQHANRFMDNISGGDCTEPGIFSLFYSIPVTYWHAAVAQHAGSILIRAFQDNQYQLGIFASAPLTSPPFENTVFATVPHLQLRTPGATAVSRDHAITQEMLQFLAHAKDKQHPFFAFAFYDAPHAYNALTLHAPFEPTGYLNYFSVNNRTSPTPMFNLYKNAVFTDDQLIDKIFLSLKKNHLDKNTVVIVTADHGQEYNEYHNNYWEHASGFSKYQIRTPMIIAWPGLTPHVYHDQTTHFDLVPTLLKRVLGVSNPVIDYSVGDDYFSKKQMRDMIIGNYAYFALLTQHHLVEFHRSGLYRFVDFQMRPLPEEPSVAASSFADATRYYFGAGVAGGSSESS